MITIKGINKNNELEYELMGGKLQHANQLIITDTTDKKIVYDKTIDTYMTTHRIPNDVLENAKTYKLLLLCLDEDDNFIGEAEYYYIPTNYNNGLTIDMEEIKPSYEEGFYYAPENPNEGDRYVNNVDEKMYIFKNNKWVVSTRGFEFISMDQGLKDFEISINECELKLPKRGTSKSAGYDIFAPYDIILQPDEEIKIPTGLKAYMQDGEVLMAFPRSGLGFTYYCRLANTIGVIDSDYYNNPKNEGHMFVKLRNEGTKEMIIKQGDGMCQMIFMPFLLTDGDSFNEGEERKGGFGSTTKGAK